MPLFGFLLLMKFNFSIHLADNSLQKAQHESQNTKKKTSCENQQCTKPAKYKNRQYKMKQLQEFKYLGRIFTGNASLSTKIVVDDLKLVSCLLVAAHCRSNE